jgi:prepilin-type N-terminal cleavage/methylation domain-containing protein/prepilin-type processing-associated H-X9-DG protein
MRMRKGFTLIELLTVIAISALLAAVLFPVFAQARAKARQSQCLSNLRQVAMAAQLYLQDYDERFFVAYYIGQRGQTQPDNYGYFFWPWLLKPYGKMFSLFWCPDEPPSNCREESHPYFGYVFGRFPAWGYHQLLFSPGIDPYNPTEYPFEGISLSRVARPAEMVLFVESITLATSGQGSTCTGYSQLGYAIVYPPSYWQGEPPLRPMSYGHCWHRHFSRFASTAFADGHVKPMTLGELRKPSYWE